MNTDPMSCLHFSGTPVGTQLQQILMGDDIQPGSDPSYQLCKTIYLYHPLGAKMVETPIKIAQSRPRQISIDGCPEQEVRDAFVVEWDALKADYYIRGASYQARIYGVGAVLLLDGDDRAEPLDPWSLPDKPIAFNILDPLNTSGSLVLGQNPNSPDFQKFTHVTAAGVAYHPSRACVKFHEQPIYIAYTSSAFGFSGRSVYQRALFPLKSFIRTMATDDMVATKAGLLIAKLKNSSSIINAIMAKAASIKRALLKEAQTNNVLSIDVDEDIESLNLMNTDASMDKARSNILKNIATAADMPAQILEQESFAEGFGEGTEDTKNIIRYVSGVRDELKELYEFFTNICQHRAWSPDFVESMKAAYPELYGQRGYNEIFLEWQKNFKAIWPSLLEEPESEQAKFEKVKLEGLITIYQELREDCDADNKARLVEWLMENANELKHLFRISMDLDIDGIRDHLEEMAENLSLAQEAQAEESSDDQPTSKRTLSLAR